MGFMASAGSDESPYKPARSLSESRTGQIMWHGQREVSHPPAHRQAMDEQAAML